ncbi:ABC transporter ATP-binding protein [Alkalicoccus daliensis]|uniref:Energy-coupling factor transport system ATP-binding protein n=1 Tax=Alkalicoccus daliensis TaxID=745820 RepID=A0A1H0KLA2_9BACI|nr:ABC transporter ATP-binding protein [Alkalicoccus daliensis]SDO56541.1 energy-coupling factor transport system ATP-binding protein [Alkalicoccus daliensis]
MNAKPLNSKQLLMEVSDFSFAFEEESPILNQLNFSLFSGECCLVAGASGSGKSTLALCLNGLYPDTVEGETKGNISCRSQNIADFPQGKLSQSVGVVFQDPESQFCMMKVEDELAFVLENQQAPRERMQEAIHSVLKETGMLDQKHALIHELSGGQKQKIALASVLLMEPDLLILDEATANLDPMSSFEFTRLIQQVRQKRNCAVLVIEHQPDDWMDIVERVLVIGKEGTLLADDSPDNIYGAGRPLLIKEGIHIPLSYQEDRNVHKNPPQMHGEKLITLQNVSFSRKNKSILQNINVTFHRGEFIAIVGENGAGKSTLLQLLARLLTPESGNVKLDGIPLQDWTERELRRISGYVFQNPEHQFITDTLYDEVAFGMKLNGEKEIDAKVQELLTAFQLEQFADANPFAISGGQKRRLSVATMLDDTPDILFFDEPTFGQDAKTTKELMRLITELREQGTTIIFVTHDMELVDEYCERVLLLLEGKTAFDGSPEELWSRKSLLQKARLRLPYSMRKERAYGIVN